MNNTRKCFHSEHNFLTLRRRRGLINTLTRSCPKGLFLPAVVFLALVLCNVEAVQRTQPVFMNEFAVRIPTGDADADRIATKHGFTNIGQIGSLKGYYLFEHQHVHKRSTSQSDTHHSLLSSEPQVDWVQQQHEKVRKKRDFTNPDFSVFGGQGDFRSLFDSNPEPRSPLIPQTSFRGFSSSSNVFPDPLFREQWYLNGGAKDGFDMNIGPAWQKGYTGKGVVVSILDDGIQTNHPDLALNYDREASIDINSNDDDPMPRDNGDNKHGTRCAGEVAAVAFNQYCGVGVAYNASIGGVRMLDGIVNDAVEARALGLNINHIDIYSASWGPEDDGRTVDGPGPLARRAFINGVTSGRHGKGSIFVWASGNGGRHIDSCNCDGYTNSIFTLSISSATQGGYRPWYLEKCSSTLSTTYSSGTPGSDKSVATVDMDGKLRPDHICTVEHTGTSASAPIAAGMCALVLEANPSLTWRDMQYIVVLTSKPGPLEKEGGWSVNGVKRRFNHNFGYGMMDGGAMVTLAEQWTNLPPQHICKSQEVNEERPIDPSYGSQLNTYMDVNACLGTLNEVRYVEHVQCKISLRFFPRGNIRILLTSPMGTTSTLLFERPRDVVSSNFDDWPFLSVHYFGEKVEGRWTLQIINGGNRHVNQPGILKKWQLIFYGTSTNPIRLRTRNPGFQGTPFAVQPAQQRASNVPGTTVFGGFPSSGFSSFGSDLFNQPFRNLPDLFGAGSSMDVSVASLNSRSSGSGSTNPSMSLQVSGNRPIEGQQVLHDCDPECDGQGCYGKGPGQCIACRQYRLDNTCVSRCPPRSFPNQGGVCWPCHESCETCAGAGQDSCLTCAPAHLRVTDLAVCLQQCPEGYFENTEEGTCVPCEPNCASCQDRPDHCTACDHHLVLYGNKCLAACPDKTYETDDYRCAPCHNSCETCIGPAAKECVTCRSGYYELSGICYSSCPVTYYPDKKRRECRPCPSGCATCTSGGQCTSCISEYELKSNDCIKSGTANCSPSQYWSGSACEKCHSTCGLCDGPAADSCLTCPDGKLLEASSCVTACSEGFYQDKGNTCTPCLHTCTQCVSRINCTMCTLPLVLQSGQCRATCANGYYSDLGACSKCYLSCMTCAGPRRDQCVTCPRGWQLAGGECHPECPTGFFMSDFGCQKCHHYCRTCKGEGPLQCTSCPTHFMLDGGLCMECLGSQYYDPPTQLCKSCHSSCRSCSGPGQFSCTSCNYPLHLDKLNNQCVPCCSKYNTGGDCCACDIETGECHNASPAGKRRIAGMAPPDNNMGLWTPTPAPLQGILITPAALSLVSGLAVVVLLLLVVLVMIRYRPNRKYGEYEKVPVFTSSSPNDERDAESRNLFTTT